MEKVLRIEFFVHLRINETDTDLTKEELNEMSLDYNNIVDIIDELESRGIEVVNRDDYEIIPTGKVKVQTMEEYDKLENE